MHKETTALHHILSALSLELWYNSYLALTITVSIDIASGIVRYKNNMHYEFGKSHEQESLFLCCKQEAARFAAESQYILDWDEYYRVGVMIDGQYWRLKIELSDGTKRTINGDNGKPDNFSNFIASFERLINKQIEFDGTTLCDRPRSPEVSGQNNSFFVCAKGSLVTKHSTRVRCART